MNNEIKQHITEVLGLDDMEVAEALFAEYRSSYRSILDEMAAALREENFEQLRMLGHKLKGSCSTIGHEAARESAFAMENAARAADLSGCRDVLAQLERRLAELKD